MRKKILLAVWVISILICFPNKTMAWGMTGHRIVGEIANSYLNAKAKIAIQKILGTESIAMSSNWADFIRSDSTFRYLNTWHYINFEKDLSYDQIRLALKTDTAVNAYTKINFLTKSLKNKTLAKETKVMYLRLLIHIVGDIHQPLHVSPVGSTGGNDIKVNWFTVASNLHRVWDEHLIEFQQLSYTEYVKAINHTTLQQRKTWQSQPLSQWLYDSYVIAQQLHRDQTEPNPRLGFLYNFDHIGTVNQQLVKGGVHLAGLLNEIFGSGQ